MSVFESRLNDAIWLQENARRRLDDLKRAMDEAKEQAEREKHEKRMRKLEEGGHQTTRYHENFEGKQKRIAALPTFCLILFCTPLLHVNK